jgi:cysteine desulfurase
MTVEFGNASSTDHEWVDRVEAAIKQAAKAVADLIGASPDTCRALKKQGWTELVYLQVDSKGRLDLERLEQACAEGLSLLYVMAANNAHLPYSED